jgi:hypothetical protein
MNKVIKTILKLCITTALLGYILWTNDLALVFERFVEISPVIWIAVFIMQILAVLISAFRISIFIKDLDLRTSLYVRLVSTAYGFILPGQIAVEGLRAYLLGKEGKEYSQPGAAVMVDKIVGIIVLLVLGVAGMLFSRNVGWDVAVTFCIAGIALILFLFSLNLTFIRNAVSKLLLFLAQKTGRLGKVFSFFIKLLEYWQINVGNKRLLFTNFIYGVLFQLLSASIGAALTYGVGAGFYFSDWLWINAIITIALILPITLGGMGVREAGMIGLLGLISVAPDRALAVSFGFLTLYLFQVIVGFGLEIIVTLRKSKSSVNADEKLE